jgi:hypothetical protein
MGNTIDTFRVLAHEDQAEFDQLLAACQTEFAPKTGHESFLTALAAQARWGLARARRFETIAYDYLLTGEFDETNPDARIVARLNEKMKDVFTFLQRQAASAETAYHRANSELNKAHLHELRNKSMMTRGGATPGDENGRKKGLECRWSAGVTTGSAIEVSS